MGPVGDFLQERHHLFFIHFPNPNVRVLQGVRGGFIRMDLFSANFMTTNPVKKIHQMVVVIKGIS